MRTRPSRYIPMAVRRAVRLRDGDQCAFVSKDGRRCSERVYLEFHHEDPYALGGPPTVDNTSLRCWRHNQYEAELFFGPYGTSKVREGRGPLEGGLSRISWTIDSSRVL